MELTKIQKYAYLQQTTWKQEWGTTTFGHLPTKVIDQIDAAYEQALKSDDEKHKAVVPPAPVIPVATEKINDNGVGSGEETQQSGTNDGQGVEQGKQVVPETTPAQTSGAVEGSGSADPQPDQAQASELNEETNSGSPV
jgi:hypothetical protein